MKAPCIAGASASATTDRVETETAKAIAIAVRDLRRALGWTQADLASRAGVSQSLVSAVERRRLADLTFGTATGLLEAMGARLAVGVNRPFVAGRERQRDAAHAACSVYVARRLIAAGWSVASEVEVGGDRSRGWIDLLAFHPSGVVLVVEIKTEIHDLGALERTLGWYEREAWAAARRRGWRPRIVVGGVILLSTDVNDAVLRDNAATFRLGFPIRFRELAAIVSEGRVEHRGRFVAMVDPQSRRVAWIRPTALDGRSAPARYPDYASFLADRQGRRTRVSGKSRAGPA